GVARRIGGGGEGASRLDAALERVPVVGGGRRGPGRVRGGGGPGLGGDRPARGGGLSEDGPAPLRVSGGGGGGRGRRLDRPAGGSRSTLLRSPAGTRERSRHRRCLDERKGPGFRTPFANRSAATDQKPSGSCMRASSMASNSVRSSSSWFR